LAKHKGNEDEIKKLEKQHKKGTDELHVCYTILPSNIQALEKANAEVAKELAKFDREDVQLQEKKKHKIQKQKKLQKAAQTSKLSHAEATTWITNHTEEVEKHTKKLAELESNLAVEEKELDSIRDALKGDLLTYLTDHSQNSGFL
jgi:structural maintenance of chromosome 4